MLEALQKSYKLLNNIISGGAFSSIELSKDKSDNHNKITKIVYGVLDNSIKYDYYISQLVERKPKNKIVIILKIALYCLYEMDSMPDYAVVDNTVKLVKSIGKGSLSGFVNAVLKKAVSINYKYPDDYNMYLSITCSKPQFLVDYYINRYGKDKAREILSVKPFEYEHVRHNQLKITREDLIEKLKELNIDYKESRVGGFFVKNDSNIYDMFNQGFLTFQSLTSMIAVQTLDAKGNVKVLDLCAAPGGKAVYIAELNPKAQVIANDVHSHRVELIRKYISRMGVSNVTPIEYDAQIINEDFIDKFDYVLVDAPCSGYGIIGKKPDIMLKDIDIDNLVKVQYNILKNAGLHVKRGGVIVYSTCTTIKAENEDIINKLLEESDEFKLDNDKSMINYLPDGNGQDGFFIARIRKI